MSKDKEVKNFAKDLFKVLDPSVVYIGDDVGYWKTLQSYYTKSGEKVKFRYVHLSFLMNLTAEQMFLRVLRENPEIIYLDFSVNTEQMLSLAKYLKEEEITCKLPKISLIDSRKLTSTARFANLEFTHIKCGEYFDVVYDPLDFSYKDAIKQPEFATAKFSLDSSLIDDMNVNYYTLQGARLEGNIRLAVGQSIEIRNSIPRKRIPSSKFFIKKSGSQDLITDSKYYYEVDFTYVDEPVFNNDELEKAKEIKSKSQRIQTIKLIKQDRQEQLDRYNERIAKAKEDQKEWVEENFKEEDNSKVKILVVDPEQSIFKSPEVNLLEEPSFSVRAQTSFTQQIEEIFLSRPSIIAVQALCSDYVEKLIINKGEINEEKEPRALSEGEQELKFEIIENEQSLLKAKIESIVRRLKEIPNYKPFIILFNYDKHDSDGVKSEYGYAMMMANKGKIDFNSIKNMAVIYQKRAAQKLEEELQRKADILLKTGKVKEISPEDLREKKVIPNPSDPISLMSYSVPITITLMTETEIVFHTEADLQLLQTFRLEHPLSLSVTIVKNQAGNVTEVVNGFNEYRALINNVDEIDKKFIRQYVNEIIFSPVKEERDKERSAFKELNDKFAKMKEEQMKEREQSEEGE